MINLLILFFALSVQEVETPQYIVTIQPLAEIVKQIVGDRGRVTKLLPSAASPHTYEPKPSDLKQASKALAMIYVADSLDGWAARIPAPKKIELISLLHTKDLISLKDGGHTHNKHAQHDKHALHDMHDKQRGVDAHFWMDPLLVKKIVPALVKQLCRLDIAGCKEYEQNSIVFTKKLDRLHTEINAKLQKVQGKAVLFSHPFMTYFFKRYAFNKIEVINKIPGQESSPKDIVKAIKYLKQNKIKVVFTLLQLPQKTARTVAESANVPVVVLDPIGAKMGYSEMIRYNVEQFVKGLDR